MQSTLSRSLSFAGIGLHGGLPARLTIRPAPAGFGIWFCRIDVADRDQMIPASWDAVSETTLCTKLANEAGVSVSTVEHVMAALAAAGIDNALLDVDGPEIPILDGSAQLFIDAILSAGLAAVDAPRRAIEILSPIVVETKTARASLSPARRFEAAFEIDFHETAIGRQRYEMAVTPANFTRELADCRTFCRRAEIDQLRAAGLAQGGNLGNAVVIDGDRVVNPGGLRRADEPVRHKLLDAIGDLALAGAPIIGRFESERGGHALTNALLHRLFDRPDAWRWVDADEEVAGTASSDERTRLAAE